MKQELELTLMLADYHRTRPILAGDVAADRIKFIPRPAVPGEACLRRVYEEFDIAEMSVSWYTMVRWRGEPVIALPMFPLRLVIHPDVFCSSSSAIDRPAALSGMDLGRD